MFPAGSVALTSNVWLPGASPEYARGLVQLEKPPPSSWHWNVLPPSVDVKLNDGEVELVGFGGLAVIVVFGAVRSTVQVKLADVGSVLPAGSVARTWKVCAPSARLE